MAWYRNIYECSACETPWEDEWSCACDDECPNCRSSDYSPVDTHDLSAFVEHQKDGTYSIYYSPPEAEHGPDYTLLANVPFKSLATVLEQMAFHLSQHHEA